MSTCAKWISCREVNSISEEARSWRQRPLLASILVLPALSWHNFKPICHFKCYRSRHHFISKSCSFASQSITIIEPNYQISSLCDIGTLIPTTKWLRITRRSLSNYLFSHPDLMCSSYLNNHSGSSMSSSTWQLRSWRNGWRERILPVRDGAKMMGVARPLGTIGIHFISFSLSIFGLSD